MKKGFTLIELLVVVLIIGILAAIAYPKYEMVLEKSRATEALIILKNIAAANKAYYMANGKYATHIDELDIDVPGKDVTTVAWGRKETKYFQFGTQGQSVAGSIAIANRLPFMTLYNLIIYDTGEIRCNSYTDKGAKICRSLDIDGGPVWG